MSLESMIEFLHLRRNVVAVLAFFGYINVYTLRVNLSVAIVDMTKEHIKRYDNGTTMRIKYFDWSTQEKGNILSAFFFGYIFTQLLGGWLGSKIGGATIFGTGIATTAFLNLLTPICARMSIYALVALRVVEGVFEGVTYPCIHAVWARWAPPAERTRLASFAYSGCFVGTVITFPACGLIIDFLGWPYAFYIPGIVGLIWYAIWLMYVKNSPEDDPYISQQELQHLRDTLGERRIHVAVPWKRIFTCVPVWAIIIAQSCENFGFYTLLTQLPSFLSGRFDYDITEVGSLSALPYLLRSTVLICGGTAVDVIRRKEIFTTTWVRKLCNCGAFLNEAVFILCAGFAETAWVAILCLTLSVGIGGFANTAFAVNPLDLAPQYASIIMGISNTFGTMSGIIGPNVAGYIVTDEKSKMQWRIVFMIAAGIYFTGAVVYGTFASGEKQPWACHENITIPKRTVKKETEDGDKIRKRMLPF